MSTDPVAAMTARDVKFSEAISWSWVFCRVNSASMAPNTSGSASKKVPGIKAMLPGRVRLPCDAF